MTQDYKPSAGEHPITPPPELVEQWDEEGTAMFRPEYQLHIATQAAQWGADRELGECCEFLRSKFWIESELVDELRAARRRKPPSLKELALEILPEHPENMASLLQLTPGKVATIRRALEALDD